MLYLSGWMLPILLSALALGFYDLCKKHAVNNNSVMPVLFFATLCGSLFFVAATVLTGGIGAVCCSLRDWLLIMAKAVLVSASWVCVYYAMRELPISIAAPIRASAPLWTFFGALLLFGERPSPLQGLGMLVIFSSYYYFSVIGKMEGIGLIRHRGMHLIALGTVLGACSALYDKYLLGVLRIPGGTVQFWFSVDLVLVLGAAYAIRKRCFKKGVTFTWRWSIPITGILLIVADFLYFHAVAIPDTQIAILSLVRRCNCIVSFAVGCWYFRDANVRHKAMALTLILVGVILLALAK